MRIGLDIDDTLVDFWGSFTNRYGILSNKRISKKVLQLRKDKKFWESLPKIHDIDFVPTLYCTKRINSKTYTRNSLKNNGFPIVPIYQMYYQHGNKTDMIKGRVDVFVDDSVSNFTDLNNGGVLCLLIDSPNNRHIDTPLRIYDLKYKTIKTKYENYSREYSNTQNNGRRVFL
jgi:hypothetical protein